MKARLESRQPEACGLFLQLMNSFFMHWAELGVSRRAVTVLILKEHTVRIRQPIYSAVRPSQSKYHRALWSDEDAASKDMGQRWGLWGCLERREPWSTGETILTTAPAPSILSSEYCIFLFVWFWRWFGKNYTQLSRTQLLTENPFRTKQTKRYN